MQRNLYFSMKREEYNAMKEFSYTIKDALGIHARPAGLLVKEAQKYKSEITLRAGDKEASAKKLFAVMGMGVKTGQQVHVSINGEDEEVAAAGMEAFLMTHL